MGSEMCIRDRLQHLSVALECCLCPEDHDHFSNIRATGFVLSINSRSDSNSGSNNNRNNTNLIPKIPKAPLQSQLAALAKYELCEM